MSLIVTTGETFISDTCNPVSIYFRGMKNMAKGLSLGRVTDVAKGATSLNIAGDAKKLLRDMAEEWIRILTAKLERETLTSFPDAKTILDVDHPQLSLNRVKGIMGDATELKQGSAAAITAKAEAEDLIREVARDSANIAVTKNMRTITGDHVKFILENSKIISGEEALKEAATDHSVNLGADMFVGDNELRHIASLYTRKRITNEAVAELRTFLEEEVNETLLRLEESLAADEVAKVERLVKSVRRSLDQRRIKAIITKAEELCEERGKKTIDVEEICDGFSAVL